MWPSSSLGDQPAERALGVDRRPLAQGRDPGGGERLAEHRRVLEDRALDRAQLVETGGSQRVQRLGNVELANLADQHVPRAVLLEQPAVEEHPDRLDRIQRHALGLAEDPRRQLVRQAGYEAGECVAHCAIRERADRQYIRSPLGALVEQLLPARREVINSGRLADHSSR